MKIDFRVAGRASGSLLRGHVHQTLRLCRFQRFHGLGPQRKSRSMGVPGRSLGGPWGVVLDSLWGTDAPNATHTDVSALSVFRVFSIFVFFSVFLSFFRLYGRHVHQTLRLCRFQRFHGLGTYRKPAEISGTLSPVRAQNYQKGNTRY